MDFDAGGVSDPADAERSCGVCLGCSLGALFLFVVLNLDAITGPQTTAIAGVSGGPGGLPSPTIGTAGVASMGPRVAQRGERMHRSPGYSMTLLGRYVFNETTAPTHAASAMMTMPDSSQIRDYLAGASSLSSSPSKADGNSDAEGGQYYLDESVGDVGYVPGGGEGENAEGGDQPPAAPLLYSSGPRRAAVQAGGATPFADAGSIRLVLLSQRLLFRTIRKGALAVKLQPDRGGPPHELELTGFDVVESNDEVFVGRTLPNSFSYVQQQQPTKGAHPHHHHSPPRGSSSSSAGRRPRPRSCSVFATLSHQLPPGRERFRFREI
eukprot:GHVU01210384.1.p1 GENE.GHVU01210384.1~~GHVU01210384.1.p1  ORF type:complete len:324 (-),score=69.08 GHVU01210384.1:114-1085(-)